MPRMVQGQRACSPRHGSDTGTAPGVRDAVASSSMRRHPTWHGRDVEAGRVAAFCPRRGLDGSALMPSSWRDSGSPGRDGEGDGMPKRWMTLAGSAAVLASLCGSLSGPAAAEPPPWANGRAAVARLGSRLDAVAGRHGWSGAGLRANLLQDPSLFVDAEDQLLYIDPPAPQAARTSHDAGATAAASAIDPSTALTLHSRPGSRRVVYLDFDGQTVSAT